MIAVLIKTFSFALKGIYYGFRTQKNLRIQLLAFVLVLLAAIFSGFSIKEYMVILFCSAMVFSVEMLNTAIEVLVDMVSPGWNEKAGMVKDIAAGAVLIVSIAAAVIGAMLFLNHFSLI